MQEEKCQASGHLQAKILLTTCILQLISDMPTSSFIQEAFQTNPKPHACAILYTKELVLDIRRLVNTYKSFVIGVDRTFKLGPCVVMLLKFNNTDMLGRSSQEPQNICWAHVSTLRRIL